MSVRRRNRLFTMLVMVLSLLFMQFAVAEYACPGNTERVAQITAMAEAGMPCADSMAASMDDARPSLCHAHCQTQHQSADSYQPPAPTAPAAWSNTLVPLRLLPLPSGAPVQTPLLMRTTAPPIAVRHCCFRL